MRQTGSGDREGRAWLPNEDEGLRDCTYVIGNGSEYTTIFVDLSTLSTTDAEETSKLEPVVTATPEEIQQVFHLKVDTLVVTECACHVGRSVGNSSTLAHCSYLIVTTFASLYVYSVFWNEVSKRTQLRQKHSKQRDGGFLDPKSLFFLLRLRNRDQPSVDPP